MKLKIFATIIHLALVNFSDGQMLFRGPLIFKGTSDESRFNGNGFTINLDKKKYSIYRNENKDEKFEIDFDNNSIEDLAFSGNRSAVAVSLSSSEWGESRMAIVTVDKAGKKKVYDYRSQKMVDNYGWVVEIGAVSDNGEMILAKCAKMLPEKDGVSLVRHEWVIVAIRNGSVKVVESVDAIDQWNLLKRGEGKGEEENC